MSSTEKTMDTEKKRWSRTRRSRRRKRNYNKGDGGRQNEKSDERNQNHGHSRGRPSRKRRDDYPPLSQDKSTYRSKITSRSSHPTTGFAQTWTKNHSNKSASTPSPQPQQVARAQHITIYQKGLEGFNTLQSFPTFIDSPKAPAF